jgi:hypothetical protein
MGDFIILAIDASEGIDDEMGTFCPLDYTLENQFKQRDMMVQSKPFSAHADCAIR